MVHIEYSKARIKQIARFYRDGSALAGTLTGGPLGLESTLEIESTESPTRIQHLAKMAESSCFAMQSMIQNVETTTVVLLNGDTLEGF